MPLGEAGEKLGPYEILALIGKGGMGEVYRAHDPRMGRDVAVKVSAEHFSERFSCEVHAVAALNHPNICHLYDVGPNYLVMEFIEGSTLAELIKRGPIPLEETLGIARQIADALSAAHEKGIVHRDLKPGNIKVKPDGTVKVLDFGLAKMGGTPTAGKTEDSPTMTMSSTQAGMILGTAAYMSPEQARGKEVDERADIWAFGVVLYEMLTGKQTFTGETITDVLAAVVKSEPDWTQVPEKAQRLLRHCLEKDRDRRLCDIRDFELLLEQAPTPNSSRPRLPWIVAAALAVALVVALVVLWPRPTRHDVPLIRLDVDLGNDVSLYSFTGPDIILSPDGTRIIYVSHDRLFTRRLDQPTATELPGTEGASAPFVSPDGRWVAFYALGKLKKISVEGGAPVVLCSAPMLYGGSWGEDGTIIAAFNSTTPLMRISSDGGTLTAVTTLDHDHGELTHRWPQILPGGNAVLFTAHKAVSGGFDGANIEVISLSNNTRKTVLRGGTFGRYLPSGHLTYVNRGRVFAVQFDLKKLEVRGVPYPILDHVAYSARSGFARLDSSSDPSGSGTVVYRTGSSADQLVTLQLLDEAGKTQPLLAKPGFYYYPRLSPNGEKVVMAVTEGSGVDLFAYEWRLDRMLRLTFSAVDAVYPIWSPDGKYVLFGTSAGNSGIYWTRSDGAGNPQLLIRGNSQQVPWSLTSDGKLLAFMQVTAGGFDVYTVPIKSDATGLSAGRPEPFLQTPLDERYPALSPDGRWMAYSTNESGAFEVYVRSFRDKAGKWEISNGGGGYPVWSPTEPKLFFRTLDSRIMVVSYAVKDDSFIADRPRLWTERSLANMGPIGLATYDVAPDGKHIAAVMTADAAQDQQHQVTFLENFYDELRRRVPVTH